MSVNRRATKRGTRYDVRLRRPDGTSYKRTFRTRREADAFEAREVADRSRGAWVDPTRPAVPFETWARQWLESNPAKRPKTLAWNADIVRGHLIPTFGARPLATIAPLDVQRFVNALNATRAPATVRGYYSVLRAILNAAVNADLIVRTPCRGIKLPAPQGKTRRILSAEEVHNLAEAIGPKYRAMVYLAAELGLRWGECAGLRVEDLDVLRRTITVRRTLGEANGKATCGAPKTASGRRTLAVSKPLADELSAHLRRAGLTASDADSWLFRAPAGGPLRYSVFRSRVWAPVTRKVGLADLTFHGLRHSAATAWVAAGVDIRTAQHRLGHSTSRLVLELYAHATTDADRAAATVMGDRLFGAEGSSGEGPRAMDAP